MAGIISPHLGLLQVFPNISMGSLLAASASCAIMCAMIIDRAVLNECLAWARYRLWDIHRAEHFGATKHINTNRAHDTLLGLDSISLYACIIPSGSYAAAE